MLLENTKKRIILNAGHWDDPDTPHIEDAGASWNNVKEGLEVLRIRDRTAYYLRKAGFVVFEVPDYLDLGDSIKWANAVAPALNDGLAIDIHLNYLSDNAARGSEAFHGTSDTSRHIAGKLSEAVAVEMDIPNRGGKPDTQAALGSLGWIRKTTMWASLIEVCFLTNAEDMAVLHGKDGYELASMGIVGGVCDIFGVTPPDYDEVDPSPPAIPPDVPDARITIEDEQGQKVYKCYL